MLDSRVPFSAIQRGLAHGCAWYIGLVLSWSAAVLTPFYSFYLQGEPSRLVLRSQFSAAHSRSGMHVSGRDTGTWAVHETLNCTFVSRTEPSAKVLSIIDRLLVPVLQHMVNLASICRSSSSTGSYTKGSGRPCLRIQRSHIRRVQERLSCVVRSKRRRNGRLTSETPSSTMFSWYDYVASRGGFHQTEPVALGDIESISRIQH